MRTRILTLLLLSCLGLAFGTKIDHYFGTRALPADISTLEDMCRVREELLSEARSRNDWPLLQAEGRQLVKLRTRLLEQSRRLEKREKFSYRLQQLGRAYEKSGDLYQADRYYRHALKAASNDSDVEWASRSLVSVFEKQERWDSLHDIIEERLESSSDPVERAEWRQQLVEALLKQNRPDQAESSLHLMSADILQVKDQQQRLDLTTDYHWLRKQVAWKRNDRRAAEQAELAHARVRIQLAELRLGAAR